MIVLLIPLVLFLIWQSWNQEQNEVGVLGYKTSYFHLSNGESTRTFEKMRADGLTPESLKLFITLEDRLLKIEQTSVCSGNPRVYEAFAISNEIKDNFLGYDFSYHTTHLKQVAEPHKLINQSVTC